MNWYIADSSHFVVSGLERRVFFYHHNTHSQYNCDTAPSKVLLSWLVQIQNTDLCVPSRLWRFTNHSLGLPKWRTAGGNSTGRLAACFAMWISSKKLQMQTLNRCWYLRKLPRYLGSRLWIYMYMCYAIS